MPFYSGQNGALLIDGNKAGRVVNWNFTSSVELLTTTTLGDTDKSSVAGLRSTNGTFALYYYADNPNDKTTNSASQALNKLMKGLIDPANPNEAAPAESVTLRLQLNDGTLSGKYIQGQAWITSVAMSMAIGEVFSATCGFEFTGALTEVNL